MKTIQRRKCGIGAAACLAAVTAACSHGETAAGPIDAPSSMGPDDGGDGVSDGRADGGDVGNADGGCRPRSVAGFEVPPFPNARPPSAACAGFGGDAGLVESYGDSCLSPSATFGSCTAFAAPDGGRSKACFDCLVTVATPDASSYGVVVVDPVPIVNYTSCIQAADPTDAGLACAQAAYASFECELFACEAICPVRDDSSQAALMNCLSEAASGPCAGYYYPAAACVAAKQGDGGTVAQICFAGNNPKEHYLAAAQYFCGVN